MTLYLGTIPLAPMSAARPRPRGRGPGVYVPKKVQDWKRTAAMVLGRTRPPEPLDGPLTLEVVCVLPRPRYLTPRPAGTLSRPAMDRRAEALGIPSGDVLGRLPADTDPKDWDNLGKLVSDALTEARVWGDDRQVVDGRVRKLWGAVGERPHVEVVVGRWAA